MELVIVILLRLPVKSLLRFKSVCKRWLHIISNPNFIKLHAMIASQKNNRLTGIGFGGFTSFHQFQPLKSLEGSIDAGDKSDFAYNNIKNCIVIPHVVGSYKVIGSCNGIVCLWDRFSKIVHLWNPTIKKWRDLPELIGTQVDILGVGYDSVSNHFKVLGIDYADGAPKLKVYSTDSDCWRELIITFPTSQKDSCYLGSNVVTNGVLYAHDCAGWLVWFDLHREDFGLVPNHPTFCSRYNMSNMLDYEGCAAMIFHSLRLGTGLHLWTLELGGDGSRNVIWTKKFAIETDLHFTCYLGAGQFYGYKFLSNDFVCFLYDFKKGETKLCRGNEESIKHTETLVSLDGFQRVDEEIDDTY